jgi:hypothetical protein
MIVQERLRIWWVLDLFGLRGGRWRRRWGPIRKLHSNVSFPGLVSVALGVLVTVLTVLVVICLVVGRCRRWVSIITGASFC